MSSDDFDTPEGGSRADFDKRQWQAAQIAMDRDQEKRREKDLKTRLRKARAAQRQLKRAKHQLEALGDMSPWEAEFIASVDERLDKYDAAFADREKGGPMEALSQKQKQVLAAMRRKVKDLTNKTSNAPNQKVESGHRPKPKSSFKKKTAYTPRVRHLEDEMGGHADAVTRSDSQIPSDKKPALRVIKGGKS